MFPSVIPYTVQIINLFSVSTPVYLQHIHVYVVSFSTSHIGHYCVFTSQRPTPHHPHHMLSKGHLFLIISPQFPPINSVCTVAIHLAPPSSLPRAVVGYSPASFFALSPLLIDRSRRKTLHTLQLTYTSRLCHSTRPRLV